MIVSSKLPDIARPDAGVVLVSEWTVGTPERQRATVDAFVSAWDHTAWPHGLLSANLFASSDGKTLLNYAQWTGEDAWREFDRTVRPSLVEQIDRAVPGIERGRPIHYRLHRSRVRSNAPVPGCVVFVSIEFDGTDELRLERWVATVFEALEAETELHPGGISGHFHFGTDGRRVLNYAEWTSEAAHQEALDRSGQGAIGPGPKWREVRNFPGLVSAGFKRYRLLQSLSVDAREEVISDGEAA